MCRIYWQCIFGEQTKKQGAARELAGFFEEHKEEHKGEVDKIATELGIGQKAKDNYKTVTTQLDNFEQKVEKMYDSTLLKISEQVKSRKRIYADTRPAARIRH